MRVTLRTEGLTITDGAVTAYSPWRAGSASGHVRDSVIEIDDLAHEQWLVSDATVQLHQQSTTAHGCVVAFRAAASRHGEPGAELDPGPLGILRLVPGDGETVGIVLDDMTVEYTAQREESCLVLPVGHVFVYRAAAPQACKRIEIVPVHAGVLDVRLDF